jgi:hypothetical protein
MPAAGRSWPSAEIPQLKEEGQRSREIAEEMDLSPASVHRILR